MSCFGACYVISHDMIHIEWSFQNLQKHLICETAVLGFGHFRVLCPVFSTWHTCHVVRHGHFTLKQLKCIQIHIQVLELTTLGKLISIMTDNAIYHFNFLSLCDQSNELHKFCFVVFLWSLLYFHEVFRQENARWKKIHFPVIIYIGKFRNFLILRIIKWLSAKQLFTRKNDAYFFF